MFVKVIKLLRADWLCFHEYKAVVFADVCWILNFSTVLLQMAASMMKWLRDFVEVGLEFELYPKLC